VEPDGRRIVTASSDKTARIWDAEGGREIARLLGHEDMVVSAAWSPDGQRIVTASENSARVWDVSRTEAITREHAVVLTAALARGLGVRSSKEAADLLMRDAPEDLYAAALARLSKEQKRLVPEVAAALRAPLHPNCYLSATQRAEKIPHEA
jgi:dipeptidyl aminopeptidase/acylaminoacyl peptidase